MGLLNNSLRQPILKCLCAASLLFSGMIGLAAPIGLPATPVSAAPTVESYKWDNVAIGGGGAVPEIVLHPKVANLGYLRTDVGNLYRWDESNLKWIALLNWIPYDNVGDRMGVGSIAVDPSDSTGNTVFITEGGNSWPASQKGRILKSVNRGDSWTDVTAGIDTWVGANWDQEYANRIAVDPNNGNVVYVATREGKLYRSTTGGNANSWTQITAAPAGNTTYLNTQDGDAHGGASGLLFIVPDKSSGLETAKNRTKVLYLGAYKDGVYRSSDGGDTWTKLANSPSDFYRAAVDSAGRLYVTGPSGLKKFENNTWSTLTPPNVVETMAIAIDPANNSNLMVAEYFAGFRNRIFRSINGGTSWTDISANSTHNLVPWLSQDWKRASIYSIAIDPFNSKRAWFTTWYDAERTNDVTLSATTWNAYAKGHEEVVSISDLVSPPSGTKLVYSGLADVHGFAHTSLTDFPTKTMGDFSIKSIDFQESNPNFMAVVGNVNWFGEGRAAYSTNGGDSWTAMNKPLSSSRSGRIAVSATSERMVWATGDAGTYYTTNRGANWYASAGVPDKVASGYQWKLDANVASDRVNGSKFYIFHYGDGKLYRSTDGGATFAAANATALPVNPEWAYVHTVPGVENGVWVATSHGLYKSDNGGTSFTQLTNVQLARLFSFGKHAPGKTNPTLFVYGKVENTDGIFRSDDMGATWFKINIDSVTAGHATRAMAGDRQVYGRVYIGTAGTGIFYGEKSSSDTQAPTAPSNLTSPAKTSSSIDLSWTASTDNVGVTGYDVYVNGTYNKSVTSTSASITGLSASTAYSLTVRAKDAAGNASAASSALSVTTDAASGATWTKCADEGGTCTFTGTRTVRYGSGTTYNMGTYTNSVACTNAVFGDPTPGVFKHCDYSSSSDTQAPTAPTGLASSGKTNTSVSLSWTASTDNVGVTGYDVYKDGAFAASVTGTTATITGLASNTAYSFTVKAKDAAGNVSAASSALSVTTNASSVNGVDLVVTSVGVKTKSGNLTQYTITVKNNGNTATPNVWIAHNFYVNGTYAGWAGATMSIAAGQSVTLDQQGSWYANAPASYNLQGVADSGSGVAETDETNNSLTVSITS